MGLEDDEAFEALAGEARSRLWRAYVPIRGTDGADEAVSEALGWAWEHRDRLVGMENPIGYLYRVGLTRTCRRSLASSAFLAEPLLPAPDEVGMPHIEPGLIPALLELPATQRAVVWLVHACGWSYAEVAEALDIGRSTVGTHTSRAMKALRRKLEVTVHG